ncbi:50S ribosomal protein L4 [Cardiobacterium valvarum]|uniref:Large ribosomal subunit protein uL4 n=1 Tax=Cardiobacterium valvarum TaxID=194702 RepID=A0A381DYC2_9GAMM|nr:50S ribosomal protein L4 [Cardiobacterium valvarum]
MNINFKDDSGKVSVSDDVFDVAFNEPLVHQVVISYLASGRMGTKAQKTRSEVSGGGRKPWKQKGSGRARAGTIRSPLWRGGGVAFAAKPRTFMKKVNRKMYRSALRGIFSELLRQKRLHVVEDLKITSSKTKDFISNMDMLGLKNSFLIITDSLNEHLFLASRNVPGVGVVDVEGLTPVSLLQYEEIIVDKVAIEKINGWLS